jgi:hypothetical protein
MAEINCLWRKGPRLHLVICANIEQLGRSLQDLDSEMQFTKFS